MEDTDNEDKFLSKVIDIDALNIEEHFRSVPAELAYYNAQYADATERFLKAKMMCERAHAKAYQDVIHNAEMGGKKVTVAAIEANIQLDLGYQCAREELVVSEAEKQRIRGKVETVSTKKDMLISLGAHIRSEMSDPMIRKETQEVREIRSQY